MAAWQIANQCATHGPGMAYVNAVGQLFTVDGGHNVIVRADGC